MRKSFRVLEKGGGKWEGARGGKEEGEEEGEARKRGKEEEQQQQQEEQGQEEEGGGGRGMGRIKEGRKEKEWKKKRR